jgi:hypothetical protein
VHTDDQSLPNRGFGVAHWPVGGVTEAYRHFRIVQTGKNSSGSSEKQNENVLLCAGIELYGHVL